jgi:hypothetical protein
MVAAQLAGIPLSQSRRKMRIGSEAGKGGSDGQVRDGLASAKRRAFPRAALSTTDT